MPEDLLANALSEAAPPPSRPEDVPEKFWDTAAGTLRVDALLKSYRELERRLSQRFAPPGAEASAEEVQRYRRALGIPDGPEDYAMISAALMRTLINACMMPASARTRPSLCMIWQRNAFCP